MTLIEIQNKLKAPKNQFNAFGKYKYRNAEDILEALKPILLEAGMSINISDEIVMIGYRYYVKATVTLMGNDCSYSTSAYAREDESKKGMDGSQITGCASSYARKYALNGMFAIDDTKDADSMKPELSNVSLNFSNRDYTKLADKYSKEVIDKAIKELGRNQITEVPKKDIEKLKKKVSEIIGEGK